MALPLLAALPLIEKGLLGAAAAGAAITGYKAVSDKVEPAIPPPSAAPDLSHLSPQLRAIYDRGAAMYAANEPPPAPPAPPSATGWDRAGDLAVSAAAAIPKGSRALVGLLPLHGVPGVGDVLSRAEGYLQNSADWVENTGLSDAALAEKQQFAQQLKDSDPGFWNEFGNAIGAAVDNPWVTANMMPNILMQMTAGGRGAAKILPANASPLLRASVGEGVFAAGNASADIGAEGGNRLYAAPIGIGTGAISFAGGTLLGKMAQSTGVTGRIGKALNAADPEQMIAGGVRNAGSALENTNKSLLLRMGAGVIREAGLEELPQTLQEQALQNLAVGKPVGEGLGTEAGLSTLLGGMMGAAANIPRAPDVNAVVPPDTAGTETQEPPPEAPPEVPPTDTAEREIFTGPPSETIVPPVWNEETRTFSDGSRPDAAWAAPEDTTPRTDAARVADAIDEQIPVTADEQAAPTAPPVRTVREEIEADPSQKYSDKVWSAVLDPLPETPTQADVEANMEAAKGVGDKRKERIRNTDWYKALPPAAEQSPTVSKGSAPNVNQAAPVVNDVPIAEDGLRDLPPVPDDVDPEGYEAEAGLRDILPTLQSAGVPDPTTQFVRKPEIGTRAGLRVLYGLIDNVFNMDTKYGKPTKEPGRANRAAYVRNVIEANPEQYPVGVIEAASQLHASMNALAAAQNAGTKMVDNQRGRYEYTSMDGALQSIPALAQKVEDDLRTFVDMVGENNVQNAMALGKAEATTKTKKVTKVNKDRAGSETKPATKFAMYLAAAKDGRLADDAISGRLIREESALAKRMGQDNAFNDIIAGRTLPTRVKDNKTAPIDPEQPVRNLILHYRFASPSTQGLSLFRALDTAFRNKGLYDTTKLAFEAPETDAPTGAGAAQFIPSDGTPGSPSIGTIVVYRNGRSQKALGHEIIHAATLAAVYDDPKLESADSKNLLSISKQLQSAISTPEKRAAFEENYGKEALVAASAIVANVGTDPLRAIAETASYGLTDGGLQKWMRDTPWGGEAAAANTRTAIGSTVWVQFKRILKSLVGGMGVVKDSVFDQFVNSSAMLLSRAEVRSSLDMPTKGKLAPFNIEVTPETAGGVDPDKQRAAHEAYMTRAKAFDAERAAAREAVAKESAARVQNLLDMTQDRTIVAPGGTAVPATPGAARKARGNTMADRAMATMADNLAFTVSNGTYRTWAEMVAGGHNAVAKWAQPLVTADPDKPLNTLAARLIGQVVDKANVPVKQQGINHQLLKETGLLAEKLSDFSRLPSVLADFPKDGHQALLDFLDTDGGPAALADLTTRTSPSTAAMVKSIYDSFRHYQNEALALGGITADESKLTPRDYVVDRKTKGFYHRTGTNARRFTPANEQLTHTYAHSGQTVDLNAVITQDGVEVDDASDLARREFIPGYYFKNGASERVMIEVGTPSEVLEERSVVPHLEDTDVYKLDTMKATGATFSHRKTFDEMRRANKNADAFVAFAAATHELVRHVETNRMVRQYAEANNQILVDTLDARAKALAANPALTDEELEQQFPDFRWMRDTPPDETFARGADGNLLLNEQGQPYPDPRKVFDLADPSARQAAGSLGAFRVAGRWVRVSPKAVGRLQEFDLGPLAGMYITGPAYTAMMDTLDPQPIINSRALRSAQATFKLANTVLSPVYYFNSVLSNLFVGYIENLTMDQIWTGLKLAVIQQWPESKAAQRYTAQLGTVAGVAEEARAMGLLLGQARTEEFSTALEQELEGLEIRGTGAIRDLTNGLVDLHRIAAKTTKGIEHAKGFASLVDNAFRNAKYMQQVAAWQDNNPGTVITQDAKIAAAETARKAFVDYQIDAPAIKLARETIFPFIAFPYRWVGLLSKAVATQPWKVANLVMALGAMNSLMAMLAGGPDNDEMQEGLQEWQRGNVWWLPGVDVMFRTPFNANGNPTVIDLRNIAPGASFSETNGSGVPDVFTPSGPLGILTAILFNKDAFFGREIWAETDTNVEIASKIGKYVSAPFIPRVLKMPVESFQRETGEDVGPLGQSRASWTNYARPLGFNAAVVNMEEGRYSNAVAKQFMMKDYNTKMRHALKEATLGKEPDWESVMEDVTDIQQQMMESLEEFDNG